MINLLSSRIILWIALNRKLVQKKTREIRSYLTLPSKPPVKAPSSLFLSLTHTSLLHFSFLFLSSSVRYPSFSLGKLSLVWLHSKTFVAKFNSIVSRISSFQFTNRGQNNLITKEPRSSLFSGTNDLRRVVCFKKPFQQLYTLHSERSSEQLRNLP